MREVGIIGAGLTRFKEHWSSSLRDLFVEAALKAIDDAKVSEIASMYVGSMSSGLFVEQEHIGPMLAEYLGVKNVPAVRVESACASGSLAFRMGFIEVASGLSDIVLVSGVEKMTDCEDVTSALAAAADVENEVFFWRNFPRTLCTHSSGTYGQLWNNEGTACSSFCKEPQERCKKP